MTVVKNCMFWRLTSYLFSLIPEIWNLVPFQRIFLFQMGSCRFKCMKLYRELRNFYRNKSQTQICSSKENAAFFQGNLNCVWLLQIDLCGGPEFYHKRSIDKHNRNCPTRSTKFDQMITLILLGSDWERVWNYVSLILPWWATFRTYNFSTPIFFMRHKLIDHKKRKELVLGAAKGRRTGVNKA